MLRIVPLRAVFAAATVAVVVVVGGVGVGVGCVPELAVPAGARLACRSGADCPSDAVCVERAGVCEPKASACVLKDSDRLSSAPDGNVCSRGAIDGVCHDGVCTAPTCGDGFVDQGEQCDDGAGNADSPNACRTTCIAPFCGDHVRDEGEQCDGDEIANGACSLSCTVACAPLFGEANGDVGDGCEATAEIIGVVEDGGTLIVDDEHSVWWDDGASVFKLEGGAGDPLEEVINVEFVTSLHAKDKLVSVTETSGFVSVIVDLDTGEVFDAFPFRSDAGCSGDIPSDFAECISVSDVAQVVLLNHHELVGAADDRVLYREIGLAKSTRVLVDTGDTFDAPDITHIAVVDRVVFASCLDGRVFEADVDGGLPARVIANNELTISAISADADDVFWTNAIDGSIARFERATGTLSRRAGGEEPGTAIAVAGDDVVFALDAGEGATSHVFAMHRDGSALRGVMSSNGLRALAVDGDTLYFLDVERNESIASGPGGAYRLPLTRAP